MTDPNKPVDYAVSTEACTECGAAIGVSCKVEIHGRTHDGAHRIRLDDAHRSKP